jgi:RimJ/RimL family protein N-acetyltransferase
MNLRPLTMADADKMLEWKNYPETRNFAIATHEEIKKEDHYKWLEENLQYFQAIIDGEKIIGAIRIENEVISIWVDRQFWNKGIATYVLQHVSKRGDVAYIVPENVASMRAFYRAGFLPVSYCWKFYTFKKV